MNPFKVIFKIIFVMIFVCQNSLIAQDSCILIDVKKNIISLIEEEDVDDDLRITINDLTKCKKEKGDGCFDLKSIDQKTYVISGTYHLSNLLQELYLFEESGIDTDCLEIEKVFENPVHRISRMIKQYYWDGLTRCIDQEHMDLVLVDEKVDSNQALYLYVPYSDSVAWSYYSNLEKNHSGRPFKVVRLPETITPEYVKRLNGKHGLLSLDMEISLEGDTLPLPYVVPGGRFNEMYGWDSYFIVLGLIEDNRIELAKAMVNHFVYQINHYGKILNANRTYYLTRSQPPFLTSMALAVYDQLPENPARKAWLKKVVQAAIKAYWQVWMHPNRLTKTGLSRYFGNGIGPPPEVEPGHFDVIYRSFAEMMGMDITEFKNQYQSNLIQIPELDIFFVHDRSVRESGHDTTYRWDRDGNRCADFVTVDLNVLLYKIEIDIAQIIHDIFQDRFITENGQVETSSVWYDRSRKRKELMSAYLWNDTRNLFFDYDFIREKQHDYVSAVTLYLLWACHPENPDTKLLTKIQAKRLINAALSNLEMAGGVAASSKKSRGELSKERPQRQWDYPYGWAPHQMLIWKGLINYGFDSIAHRLIYKWLYMILKNAVDYNGMIPEKFDVVKCSHEVFAEYGNVGTKFNYITREGFGWMNASYKVGLGLLPESYRFKLEQMVLPKKVFEDM